MKKGFINLNDLKIDSVNENKNKKKKIIEEQISKNDIAIIGMSCRFAEVENLSDYWNVLSKGKECVREIPEVRKNDVDKYYEFYGIKEKGKNVKYKKISYLNEIDKFDHEFFGINLKEAELMDPGQRQFLEIAWKALEDAGYAGDKIKGSKTGVYLGVSSSGIEQYSKYIEEADEAYVGNIVTGNLKSIMASRLSYLLDLKGPAMAIDTACSSALVSLHLACQAIIKGECENAIIGGSNLVILPSIESEDKVKIGIESLDNSTKTFDDSSDGTNTGEGVAAIVIKSLDAAIRDNDHIYAVIKGSAINQDGKSIGITAPNVKAQESVILDTWKNSKVNPETISYIEAHGTGTKLGDPIEVKAIKNAFNKFTNKKQFCAIASVKSNIGHTNNIAGLASIIKVALAMNNKLIPPSINFKVPNRNIDFIDSPVYVNDELKQWKADGKVLRSGISSFGMSGTNAHIILEEPPKTLVKNSCNEEADVLTLSAKTINSLKMLIDEYNNYINQEKFDLEDLCYTANTGREHFKYRIALVIKNNEELTKKLIDLKNRSISEDMFKSLDSEDNALSIKSASDNINKFNLSNKKDIDALNKVCELYVRGVNVNWKELYKNENRRIINIPTYCFEKERCWFEMPKDKVLEYKFLDLYKILKNRGSFNSVLKDLEDPMEKVESYLKSVQSKYKQNISNNIKLLGKEDESYTNSEKILAEYWNEVTGDEKIDIYEDFFNKIDSLQATIFLGKLREKYELSLTDIYRYNTINSLANYVKDNNSGLKIKVEKIKKFIKEQPDASELLNDPNLKKQIEDYKKKNMNYEKVDVNSKKSYKNVLLTGATGYLGCHILRELLYNIESKIYVIVRNSKEIKSEDRFKEKLKYYFSDELYNNYKSRIVVVTGDITKEELGMNHEEYINLSEIIDCIIHSAANVNHFGKYSEFENVNVNATRNLLNFAKYGLYKDFNYISTLALGEGKLRDGEVNIFSEYDKSFELDDTRIEGYYSKTKLLAEKLVFNARKEGLITNIYRIGNITFDSISGEFQQNINNNAFYLLLQSFVKLGLVPDMEIRFDFSFVDYVSRAIALLFNLGNLQNEIYHIRNPHLLSISDMLTNENLNIDVKKIPIDEFLDYLCENNNNKELTTYIQNLFIHMFGDLRITEDMNDSYVHMVQRKTNNLLYKLGFEWPKTKEFDFTNMINYCRKINFI